MADAAVGAVVREYAWADPGKWGLLWQQQGVACNGPQVPEPVVLPLGGSAAPQETARRRRRGGDGEEEDEYVGRWGRRVWRMKGAKKEWFNGRVVKGPKRRDEVKPADKCYVMRYKPQDDPQGRATLEKLTEAQVIRACENYERAVQQGECAREDTDSDDDPEQQPPQPQQQQGGATPRDAADSGRGKKRVAEEAGLGGGEERGGVGNKRKKGPSISEAAARRLLQHLAAFFGPSPGAFAAARALYCGAERLFPRWERRVDGEGRHVYQWAAGKKVWHCYTRMQVRETQEEEGATPLPPRIQLSTTPRPAQPTPKPALPTPRLPAPRPPPLLAKPPSRNSSPRPPSPSPPPVPRPPSAPASKRPRPATASSSGEVPVVFSFEGPPPGCRLTPAQEAEVMEVVRAQGWEIRQEVRKHGISAGQVDKYYMPPNGDKRLTSLRKVRPATGHHGCGVSPSGGLLPVEGCIWFTMSYANAPCVLVTRLLACESFKSTCSTPVALCQCSQRAPLGAHCLALLSALMGGAGGGWCRCGSTCTSARAPPAGLRATAAPRGPAPATRCAPHTAARLPGATRGGSCSMCGSCCVAFAGVIRTASALVVTPGVRDAV